MKTIGEFYKAWAFALNIFTMEGYDVPALCLAGQRLLERLASHHDISLDGYYFGISKLPLDTSLSGVSSELDLAIQEFEQMLRDQKMNLEFILQ